MGVRPRLRVSALWSVRGKSCCRFSIRENGVSWGQKYDRGKQQSSIHAKYPQFHGYIRAPGGVGPGGVGPTLRTPRCVMVQAGEKVIKAKDRITLANGDVMTLADALKAGRVRRQVGGDNGGLYDPDAVPRGVKVKRYLVRDGDTVWTIGKTLFYGKFNAPDTNIEGYEEKRICTDEEGNPIDAGPKVQQEAPAVRLRRQAAELRVLAARGMSPRKYAKEAARLEAEADKLDAGLSGIVSGSCSTSVVNPCTVSAAVIGFLLGRRGAT